jgi:methyl-accepting chemotaxis protein
MTLGELPTGGLYIDLGLGIAVFLLLFYEIAVQHRTRKKIAELEKTIVTFQHYQEEVLTNLEHRANTVKDMLFEKTKPLAHKLNELSKRANAILEKSEAFRRELENKVGPLQAAIDDTNAKVNSSNDAVRKVVQEGKSEIERMAKEVKGFAEEIQQMKNFIREGTIDLEL